MRFREPAYAVLSAVLGMMTLLLGMLTAFFVFAGIRGALNQAVPHDSARLNAVIICFAVAIAFALVAVVCGRLTYKCMRVASRE
jgi:phosphotransferase system  glucose/maltose/N-acetylglucosamine-specific IIC component